jgi:hypothetical protein
MSRQPHGRVAVVEEDAEDEASTSESGSDEDEDMGEAPGSSSRQAPGAPSSSQQAPARKPIHLSLSQELICHVSSLFGITVAAAPAACSGSGPMVHPGAWGSRQHTVLPVLINTTITHACVLVR